MGFKRLMCCTRDGGYDVNKSTIVDADDSADVTTGSDKPKSSRKFWKPKKKIVEVKTADAEEPKTEEPKTEEAKDDAKVEDVKVDEAKPEEVKPDEVVTTDDAKTNGVKEEAKEEVKEEETPKTEEAPKEEEAKPAAEEAKTDADAVDAVADDAKVDDEAVADTSNDIRNLKIKKHRKMHALADRFRGLFARRRKTNEGEEKALTQDEPEDGADKPEEPAELKEAAEAIVEEAMTAAMSRIAGSEDEDSAKPAAGDETVDDVIDLTKDDTTPVEESSKDATPETCPHGEDTNDDDQTKLISDTNEPDTAVETPNEVVKSSETDTHTELANNDKKLFV